MQSIDIRTSQNVVINFELAPLRDRFIGFFLDLLIVVVVTFLLIILFSQFAQGDGLLGAILNYLFFLLFLFYSLGFEVLNKGQSLGKMAMSMKVMKLDGTAPSLSDFIIRTIFHLIDSYLCIGVLGGIFIATSERSQRMGDRAANTIVVKLKGNNGFLLNEILNISTIENYEPQYPEIKNIGEADMLLVKNAILRHKNNPSLKNAEAIKKLTSKMLTLLEIKHKPENNIEFLKTLIKDYIVLTR